MSHFVVTVCLSGADVTSKGITKALDDILAPFDENTSVKPYRDYECDSPEDFWWTRAVRNDAKEYRDGMDLAALTAKHAERMSSWDKYDPAERAANDIATAAEYAKLDEAWGDSPTWRQVVDSYNAHYGHDKAVATLDDDGNDDIDYGKMYVTEDGRAYNLSTYNPVRHGYYCCHGTTEVGGVDIAIPGQAAPCALPHGEWPHGGDFEPRHCGNNSAHERHHVDRGVIAGSQWDWWVVGGRWQRRLIGFPGVQPGELIFGRSGTFGDNGEPHETDHSGIHCDGGPVELLDFEAVRDAAVAKELGNYDRWTHIVAEHGAPPVWDDLLKAVDAKDITIEQARQIRSSHPAIEAWREAAGGFIFDWPDETFAGTREQFEQRIRNAAVPGYALVTTEGQWVAPGKMGWFGMSSDDAESREQFKTWANEYLAELPRGSWVVQIDCHI